MENVFDSKESKNYKLQNQNKKLSKETKRKYIILNYDLSYIYKNSKRYNSLTSNNYYIKMKSKDFNGQGINKLVYFSNEWPKLDKKYNKNEKRNQYYII